MCVKCKLNGSVLEKQIVKRAWPSSYNSASVLQLLLIALLFCCIIYPGYDLLGSPEGLGFFLVDLANIHS